MQFRLQLIAVAEDGTESAHEIGAVTRRMLAMFRK